MPVLAASELDLPLLVLLHNGEGRCRQELLCGGVEEGVAATDVGQRHRLARPVRRFSQRAYHPAQPLLFDQFLEQLLGVLRLQVLWVASTNVLYVLGVVVPAVGALAPSWPHLAHHVEAVGEVVGYAVHVGVVQSPQEVEEDEDLRGPDFVGCGKGLPHRRRPVFKPLVEVILAVLDELLDFLPYLPPDPMDVVAELAPDDEQELLRRLEGRPCRGRVGHVGRKLPENDGAHAVFWCGCRCLWRPAFHREAGLEDADEVDGGGSVVLPVCATSMHSSRAATPQCQPLPTSRCLVRASTPLTSVNPFGMPWSCSLTSGGGTTSRPPLELEAGEVEVVGRQPRGVEPQAVPAVLD